MMQLRHVRRSLYVSFVLVYLLINLGVPHYAESDQICNIDIP